MKTIPIRAEERTRRGKGGAREARRSGRIPGVLYGQGQSIALTVDRKEFARALIAAHGENVIFDVTLPGRQPLKSLAREIQTDPLSRSLLHVDFQHIDMNRKIHVAVAVVLTGEPHGVKNQGGILEHLARELEVSCLPADIPESIRVDVAHLGIGDSVHVSDLTADRFELLEEPTKVVVLVSAPTVEKTPAETAAETAAAEATAAAAAPAPDAPKE